MDDYDLDFDTSSDADYENEIDFLYLRERYNYHKCEALRLADLKVNIHLQNKRNSQNHL